MHWQKCLGLDLDIPNDFGHWLAGFVDGEGCFVIVARKRDDDGYSWVEGFCRLLIKLRDDDLAILQEIKATLNVGRINNVPIKEGNNQAVWEVCRISDIIHVIIPLFEQYPLRAKKGEDFKIWKRAAHLVHAKEHHTEEGYKQLVELKCQLQSTKKYNGSVA